MVLRARLLENPRAADPAREPAPTGPGHDRRVRARKIMERCRRGKQSPRLCSVRPTRTVTSARGRRRGALSVAARGPGVRKISWVGQEDARSVRFRRLQRDGVPTRTEWLGRSVIWSTSRTPPTRGRAFGKTRSAVSRSASARGRPERPGPISRVSIFGIAVIAVRAVARNLRGGSGSTRGNGTPSRPAPWRPLPPSGLGRLQAVRLRLLRQAGEPGPRRGETSTPTTAARAPTPIASVASACAGISSSALMSWTPPSGKTCVTSCPSPSGYGRSTSGGCKGRRRAQNAR